MILRRSNDERIPPGQHLTRGWPVLHEGPIPRFDPATWRFRCFGLVEREIEWTWDEFTSFPRTQLTSDFHCVTAWSKLDNTWEGVSIHTVAEAAAIRPDATHVLALAPYAYSANIPLEVLLDDDVLLAWSHDGAPLEPEHGGPLRLVVPKRYAWKSVKWIEGLQVLDRDVRGYWEERGYHNNAEPFAEERYSWQESG